MALHEEIVFAIYEEFYMGYDTVIYKTVKTDNYMYFLDFIPLYAPLQY